MLRSALACGLRDIVRNDMHILAVRVAKSPLYFNDTLVFQPLNVISFDKILYLLQQQSTNSDLGIHLTSAHA
jgi:hypothetical protein